MSSTDRFAAGENDLTVEYCYHDDGYRKLWCVSRRGAVLAMEHFVDDALTAARRIARVEHCRIWLVGFDGLIPIDVDGPPSAGE